mmetsp:Transcript_5588/g.7800  ORF Transcript_5588/g.7800 Transcript_5588/m.7800 type:complete len:368 (+) Transcript_5588:754-1857(+)
MDPLDKAIQDKFLPAVFGREMLSWEKELVKAAVKRGGLGIRCPTETAKDAYQMSVEGTAKMVEAVRQGTDLVEEEHNDQLREVRREMKARWEKEEEENVERLVADLPKRPKRALERVRKENMSGWLTVGPSKQYGFDLSREMFRDRLNLRHGQELRGLPSVCDGCGAPFSLEHALNCMKGGNIKLGHDQVRDECVHLCTMAYGAAGVKKEPFLRDASGNVRDKDLRADFLAIGVWERQRVAFFDNRILDADAPSRFNCNMSYVTAMRTAVQEKKKKYQERCEDLAGSFTPLVCTVDGVFHREFVAFMKRVAAALAEKWHKPYGVVMCWVRVRLQFALIRAVDLRLRGSRKAFHGFGMMDGAGMGLVY